MNEGRKFLDAVSSSAKMMFKQAHRTCEANPVEAAWILDPLARWSERAYGETIFAEAAKGYARYSMTVAKAQQEYEKSGVYNSVTLSEIKESVYEDPDYMIPYMWAAVLIYPFWPSMTGHIRMYRDQFLNALGQQPNILELGCGHGVLGLLAAEHRSDATVHGIDLSHSAIEIAEKLLVASGHDERVRVEVRDATELPADGHGEQYDGIVMAMLAEHLEDPYPLMETLKRKLAPGGIAYFSTAIESPQPDHFTEFHSESEVIQLAERVGVRARSMISEGNRFTVQSRFRPRAVAMILEHL